MILETERMTHKKDEKKRVHTRKTVKQVINIRKTKINRIRHRLKIFIYTYKNVIIINIVHINIAIDFDININISVNFNININIDINIIKQSRPQNVAECDRVLSR